LEFCVGNGTVIVLVILFFSTQSKLEMEEDQDLDLNFTLLENMDLTWNRPKSKKRKKVEEEYEVRSVKETNKKLPVKVNGKLIYPEIQKETKSEEEENVSEYEAEPTKIERHDPIKKEEPPKSIGEMKNLLADIALGIIEDPEKNIGSLKKLNLKSKTGPLVKLQILTQLTVFKDIIPLYRIVKYPESDQKLSKEVKGLRQFEQTLLNCYQEYLLLLESLLKNPIFKPIAIQCFCQLLETHPHFNFRINLMTVVVQILCSKDYNAAALCAKTLENLLKVDESGEYGLEVVKLIAEKVQTLKHQVLPISLEPLLILRLQHELKPIAVYKKEHIQKKDRQHLSKEQRKKRKVMKEVEKEMMEAEAVINHEDRQKVHSETLKFVFLIYFRILKQAAGSNLVPVVLEGLSLYTHLINVDFFDDLLKVLKDISTEMHQNYADDKDSNPITALHCVISALELVESCQGAVEIDMTDFYALLYTIMSRLGSRSGAGNMKKRGGMKTRGEMELVLKGVDFMLQKHRKIPIERVGAFVKRMATLCLSLSHNDCIATLKSVKKALMKFPSLEAYLDADGRLGTGIYDPYRNDPQLCNPFATSLWEISLLTV
jgi:nucleolar complex protein 3